MQARVVEKKHMNISQDNPVRSLRALCGAQARRGNRSRMTVEFRQSRCWHGGCSRAELGMSGEETRFGHIRVLRARHGVGVHRKTEGTLAIGRVDPAAQVRELAAGKDILSFPTEEGRH